MKLILFSLFFGASITGRGQYISNDRWALFNYPNGFDSIVNGTVMGSSRPMWRSADERQDTALSLIVEYVKKIWLDEATNDFKHRYQEGLFSHRLDSIKKKLDSVLEISIDPRIYRFNVKMDNWLRQYYNRRLDSLQHRLDSLEDFFTFLIPAAHPKKKIINQGWGSTPVQVKNRFRRNCIDSTTMKKKKGGKP